MSNKKEQVKIYFQDALNVSQRAWLAAKLKHEKGVISAWFDGEDPHYLTIHYECDHFSHITLLDTIKNHGYYGEMLST